MYKCIFLQVCEDTIEREIMEQLEVWKEHTRNMSVDTVLQEYHMPAVF